MTKNAIITAAVLALGVASIAADADGPLLLPAAAELALSSLDMSALAAPGEGSELAGNSIIKREVRLVATRAAPVNSCDAAHWPYYPADCLKRVKNSGL